MASRMYYSTPVGSRHNMVMQALRKAGNGIVAYAHWMAMREMCFENNGVLDLSDTACRRQVARELEMKVERLDEFCGQLAELGEIDEPLWSGMHHVAFPAVSDELAWIASKARP